MPPSSPRAGRTIGLATLCLTTVLAAGCVGTISDERSSPSAPPPSQAGETRVPLTVLKNGRQVIAFVPVTIQGEGPFRFVLDTGASSSAVGEDVARKLDLPRTGQRQPISGVTGTEKVPVVEVSRWSAGKTDLGSTEAIVIDMKASHGTPGIQGLLGSDVLSRFGRITVDYQGKALFLPSRSR
ncbi:hypothetical protein ADL22_23735 [Streptomyces sp. NRRL F-4489]|uniref:retropepsin-like aspartic protease n=1 Tax=Streptomyces sp. NRRL F-4489 TaxID=1609095 RepID=UPI000746934D|nr:retropepsin-like aspartic protease [Streptomyces sp. NRRL F-4489]KUL36901.1 hypothetical protein ADL22_23735 [Streptomyces sp. NRRL F-4489]